MAIEGDLARLAHVWGIATEYWDQGHERHEIPREAVISILRSLGVDATNTAACRAAIREADRRHWSAAVAPALVFRRGTSVGGTWTAWIHAPRDAAIRAWALLEDGGRRSDLGAVERRETTRGNRPRGVEEFGVRIPDDMPLGWHRFVAEVDGREHDGALVICPERIEAGGGPARSRGWGITTQLYSMRSRRSWGMGDLADLDDLATWAALDLGADFALVNPLHAAAPVPEQSPSPYLPATRRFANPIYARVEWIDEYAYVSGTERAAIDHLVRPLHAADRSADLIDRNAAWVAKREALEIVFGVRRSVGREAAYRQYRKGEGAELERFALWCALAEQHGPYWNEWPVEIRRADSTASRRAADEFRDRIEFHCWTQWIVSEQLARIQADAHAAGMSVGVIHDLAVGVDRFGADTWMHPELFASDVSVGAPPDGFNQMGQDWSQPPFRPDRLLAAEYRPVRDMLRTLLRHAGGLRIDHILGFFRLWWIPAGSDPSQGTYVRYDHEALLDILVLEANRAGALIVGEDLGTVEPWVAGCLAERGILGTDVLWFERREGRPRPPEAWRSDAMAAVSIHDLPPAMGYLEGTHVRLREELGLLSRDPQVEGQEHREEIVSWRAVLVDRGLMREDASLPEMMIALYRWAAWSPARLLAVALPDLCGDVATQNQPGTDTEYPNWRIPLCGPDGAPVLLEDLAGRPELVGIVSAVGGGGPYRASRS